MRVALNCGPYGRWCEVGGRRFHCRRGRGKPHMCEEPYRDGGTTVYVCRQHPNGLTVDHYRKLLKAKPDAAKWRWQVMRRNPVA